MEGATCFLPEGSPSMNPAHHPNAVKSLNSFTKLSHRLFKGWNKLSAESRTPSATNGTEISLLPFKGRMTVWLSKFPAATLTGGGSESTVPLEPWIVYLFSNIPQPRAPTFCLW